MRPYLDSLTPEFVHDCLAPYGAWDEEELSDHEANLERFISVAIHDAQEARRSGEKQYLWVYMEAY